MKINLQHQCGLPVILDTETCLLRLGEELNIPDYRVRMLHDLDAVRANPEAGEDREVYRYTSGLWLGKDETTWKKANVIYGIVVFAPGIIGKEYNKSAGQYHPIIAPNTQSTPEVYTVLHGTGHFMLQRSSPPYEVIDDAVMVEVQPGESFVVPPDYGHLQINRSDEPLAFSYVVMDGMAGVYEPFRKRRGAMYYEMADKGEPGRFDFNSNYKEKIPLRVIKAREIRQLPFLDGKVTYQTIRDNLHRLDFLTDCSTFPKSAAL